uniref:Uncharacterized protein n=1 Tax=Timspurckia oligopyrenoides TaxID=708627 RepID=A0A7S0ZI99_9RHOD|mmetsp:Transcript_5679/g.9999  ORF Transcript_5679/g.9999 Transcript_5679/m.9999 type:complete len:454 (+) Transcript_5679:119-1480(+)
MVRGNGDESVILIGKNGNESIPDQSHDETHFHSTEVSLSPQDEETGTPSKSLRRTSTKRRKQTTQVIIILSLCIICTLIWFVFRIQIEYRSFKLSKSKSWFGYSSNSHANSLLKLEKYREQQQQQSESQSVFIGDQPVDVEQMLNTKAREIERRNVLEKLALEEERRKVQEQKELLLKEKTYFQHHMQKQLTKHRGNPHQSLTIHENRGEIDEDSVSAAKFQGIQGLGYIDGVQIERLSFMLYRIVQNYSIRSVAIVPCDTVVQWMPSLLNRLDFDVEGGMKSVRCVYPNGKNEEMNRIKMKFDEESALEIGHVVVTENEQEWNHVLSGIDLVFSWNWIQKLMDGKVWSFLKMLNDCQVKYFVVNNNKSIKNTRRKTHGIGEINLRAPPYRLAEPLKVIGNLSKVLEENEEDSIQEKIKKGSVQMLVYKVCEMRKELKSQTETEFDDESESIE